MRQWMMIGLRTWAAMYIWGGEGELLGGDVGVVESGSSRGRSRRWRGRWGSAARVVSLAREVLGGAGGLLGVDADGGVDLWQARALGSVGDLEGLLHGGGAVAYADGENGVWTPAA